MFRRIRNGVPGMAEKLDWADPGYFSGESRIGNSVRVLVQLIRPPRGHRTIPTKTGSMLILVTIGVGTAAFNSGQNILYLALSMFLSTILVSGLLSWLNFKGCRWKLDCGRHFRVGEPSPVYLEIKNTKRYLPTYALTFLTGTKSGKGTHSLLLNERMDPGCHNRLDWYFVPDRRGRESIQIKGMVSCYPFGFLKKSISDSYTKEVIVWPARVPYQFSGDKAGRRWQFGKHRRKGDGVELISLRDYRSGDSLRRIHWKATARLGKLQTRETEQEHHQAFSILVDPSRILWANEEQFERMCSFAGTLAEDLYQHDQLQSAHVLGMKRVVVGAIEDLYTFLDQLGTLDRDGSGEQSPAMEHSPLTVRFIPGPEGTVLARMEEGILGQA